MEKIKTHKNTEPLSDAFTPECTDKGSLIKLPPRYVKEWGELVTFEIQEKQLIIGDDAYDYLYVNPWPSLGTSIAEKQTLYGFEGPLIMISSQIQERINNNDLIFVPIFLHEFGHQNCGHRGKSDLKHYTQKEIEANNWAIKTIQTKYQHAKWKEGALHYLIADNERNREFIKTEEKENK